MFCSSLRKRENWDSLVSLLSKDKDSRWKETALNTHDIAIPLKPINQQRPTRFFRFILLSPPDVGTPETQERLERLYSFEGGRHAGIVFHLAGDAAIAYPAFYNLQIELMNNFSMPLLPITTLEELPKTVQAFRASIDLGEKGAHARPPSAMQTLLPHCAVGRALQEHTVNVLSDVTTGFRDLVEKMHTEEGRQLMLQYLEEGEAGNVMEFWEGEYQVM